MRCEVYSTDLGFAPEKDSESRQKFFQAEAEHLPVKDNTFDLTISRFAVPMMINNPERMEMAIREMARATRKGGEIRFSPIDQVAYHLGTKSIKSTTIEWWPDERLRQKVQAILNKLINGGYEVRIDSITNLVRDFDGKEADLATFFTIIRKSEDKNNTP